MIKVETHFHLSSLPVLRSVYENKIHILVREEEIEAP